MEVEIVQNIDKILSKLPSGVKLIAVSKMKPAEDIMSAYKGGHRCFGESKAQELAEKYELLPKDIEWHFIGHLQSNKVKYIAPFITLIHSVDGLKLLETINKEGTKNGRVIDCLLQFHIAKEESKFGMSEEEVIELLESELFRSMQHVRIVGVMGIATFTDSMEEVRKEFQYLKQMYVRLKQAYFSDTDTFKEISMGMSDDYMCAVEEGSTMVRVGSSIFGQRYYSKN